MQRLEVSEILERIMHLGRHSKPRDEGCRELMYFQTIIDHPWSTYPDRNYNLDYLKREFQWYLGANPYDDRIANFAKMWKKILQPDGRIFSNYGYYWFGPQNGFAHIINTLKKDPDSRQAYLPMCNYSHIFPGNPDVVCTKGIQFRIEDDMLHMHVAMRSSDAIFGLATDLPCFYFLWKMVSHALRVETGSFVFSADSVHVYERHWEMASKIIKHPLADIPDVPEITNIADLIHGVYESPFGQWLTEVSLDDED